LNRRIRIGILIALIGIVLLAGGFLIFSNIVRSIFVIPTAQQPQPTPITRAVVVTSRDIPLGSVINSGDINTVDVDLAVRPIGAVEDIDLVIGRMAKVPLAGGDWVMNHHLADPNVVNRDLAFELDDSMVLMAFPSNDLMSRIRMIQRGDVIDILVSMTQTVPISEIDSEGEFVQSEDETLSRLFTFSAMQQVGITGIVVEVAQDGATGAPQAYLLALPPQDALVLKHLKDIGVTFDYVLRSPTSTEFFDLTPVISEYLIQKYELEVPR
jgi:Flp pilus assembly protein CpaB